MSKNNHTDNPYCEAQVGGMMCGRPVNKWGRQCAKHDPDSYSQLDKVLVEVVNKTEKHLGHSGRTVSSDHIKQAKSQILTHYIKKTKAIEAFKKYQETYHGDYGEKDVDRFRELLDK